MVYKHAVVFMLIMVKMLLKGEVGGCALNSHGNYIVDHGKSWNCDFEFPWEPCHFTIRHYFFYLAKYFQVVFHGK